MKARTAAQRKADAARARRWREANPELHRANSARHRARHPLTAEQRARNAETNRAWRLKNAARLKREQRQHWLARRDEANAARRAKYALDRDRHRARVAAWKAAHPDHSRQFYHRHREKFTGEGRWSKRAQRLRGAWRKFTQTCAANRRVPRGTNYQPERIFP